MRVNNINNNNGINRYSQINQNKINFKGHKLVKVFNDPNFKDLKVFVYELTNGQRVVIVPKKGPDAISVKTVVKTGSLNEPDRLRGISHFLEHLVFDGSKKGGFDKGLKPNEFKSFMEERGVGVEAYTGSDKTYYPFSTIGVSPKVFFQMLKAHAALIKYPSLPPSQYKKTQLDIMQEIKQRKDQPEIKLYFSLVKNLMGIKSAYSDLVVGEEKTIAQITRKDVFNYHRQNYSPDLMETYVVGNVNQDKTIKLIDKLFDTPDFRPVKTPRIFEEIHPLEETHISFLSDSKLQSSYISIGFVGPENSSLQETVATKALLYILDSGRNARFNKKLSTIDTECIALLNNIGSHPSCPQILRITTPVQPGREQEALDCLKQTIDELKAQPITQEELDIAKTNLLNRFNKRCQDSDGISEALEHFSTSGGTEAYEKYVEYIKNLTLEEIHKVAQKYITPNKAEISILQPENAQNKNISFKGRTNLIATKFLKRYHLPNNIKLIINDNPNTSRSAINFSFETETTLKESAFEILCQMLMYSTSKHTTEELAFEKAKSALNDITIEHRPRKIIASSNPLTESLATALKLIKEMLFEPKFEEETFQKTKRELMLGLQGSQPNAIVRAFETMYPNNPLGITPEILMKELGEVTLEDVKKCYEDILKTSQVKVSITGPLRQHEGLTDKILKDLSAIENTFSNKIIPPFHFQKLNGQKVAVQVQKNMSQSEIIQLFHIETEDVNEIASLTVLNEILSGGLRSRLFRDLRDKQKLAYEVGSLYIRADNFGQNRFIIKTGILDDAGNLTGNIEKSILGFEKHQKLLMHKLTGEKELDKAKRNLKRKCIQQVVTADTQNDIISTGSGNKYGAEYANKINNAIQEVTPEDIRAVARKYFTQPSVISVLTTEEAAKEAETFLKSRGEYKLYSE